MQPSNPSVKKLGYRADIDGLRALAVTTVVLFHAGFGCPGGYVGVDVFFVISGFLISSLIWKDLEAGSFSFLQFWERRARRIVPALAVMIMATLLAGCVLLFPSDLVSLGRAAGAQVLFAANIQCWFESGYFAGVAEEKPLLHTWSLAVEEQFYSIVPWVLWFLFASAGFRRRSVVLACLAAVWGLSFALSLWCVAVYPSAAFYLLPTRAWELLCGTLVALLPMSSWLESRRLVRECCGLLGVSMIVVPVVIYSQTTAFPGLAALPPCLGAALLIWSNQQPERGQSTWVGRLLSQPAVVFLGLISYSLYLWHWPLFAYAKVLSLEPLSSSLRLALLSASILLAMLSWKYVETPFRTRRLARTRKSVFLVAGSGLATIGLCGLVFIVWQGVPQRFPERALIAANASSEERFIHELSVTDIRAGKLVSLGSREATKKPTVLVWGDSHAMAALPAVDALLTELGLAGQAATHSSTLPVSNWYVPTKYGLGEAALEFNDEVLAHVEASEFTDVILIAYWRGYGLIEHNRTAAFEAALLETVGKLVAMGRRAWVMLDVPVHGFDVPKALARTCYSSRYIATLCSTPSSLGLDGPNSPALQAKIEALGGKVVDPRPMFLSPSGEHYVVSRDGTPLYRDQNHLTTQAARLLLLPILRNSMLEIGR